MTGLLDGMRVLDLSSWRPMPHATQILADLGAEVLKVEPPGGDPMRVYPAIFASISRGKRSIELNLRTEAGLARALELAAEAHVVCEAWRPGVAERLGVGYDAVAAINPTVIYASITGYGQDGPWRDVPGHDLNFQAVAGAVAPRLASDGTPEIPRLPVADLAAGTFCSTLLCAAWARRAVTGEGERIDVAMADTIAWWVGPEVRSSHADSTVDASVEDAFTAPGYGVFETRDGGWITLAVISEERLWAAVCSALGLDDLVALDYPARLARGRELNDRIAAVVLTLDRDDAVSRLLAGGAPVSPALTAAEATRHEQLRARGVYAESPEGRVPLLPAVLSAHPRREGTRAPVRDEHSGWESSG